MHSMMRPSTKLIPSYLTWVLRTSLQSTLEEMALKILVMITGAVLKSFLILIKQHCLHSLRQDQWQKSTEVCTVLFQLYVLFQLHQDRRGEQNTQNTLACVCVLIGELLNSTWKKIRLLMFTQLLAGISRSWRTSWAPWKYYQHFVCFN